MNVDPRLEERLDRLALLELPGQWFILRDTQDWEKFLALWHEDGVMMTTWGGRATPEEFTRAAAAGFERGDRMLHTTGGMAIELAGTRAIGQSKMRIMQRGPVEGVLCDVTCIGRNYDFFEKRGGRWGFVLRQPIYERDEIVPVNPGDTVTLDPQKLARFPEGYARLAYLQEGLGYTIKTDMPVLTGPQLDALYAQGKAWLAGEPLTWGTT